MVGWVNGGRRINRKGVRSSCIVELEEIVLFEGQPLRGRGMRFGLSDGG